MENEIMKNDFMTALAFVFSSAAFIISALTFVFNGRKEIIKRFEHEYSPEFIAAKRVVYSLGKSTYSPETIIGDKEIADSIELLINFYNFSELTIKKLYIRRNVLTKTSFGETVVHMYRILFPYIEYRRSNKSENPNSLYAKQFEDLYDSLKKE